MAANYMSSTQSFSPKSFLQNRRPEHFSDSIFVEERKIDRQRLEYHLETLTNRGQETAFERFARRLAERELCPNLLPQTGPTGGGDSKVDSETYPVAESLAFAWLTGENTRSAHERWAFAFSTAKQWKRKFEDDIKKLVLTKRSYVRAFFVTNQFVSDRTQSKLEDKLSKLYALDVRILDRNWILNRVFSGDHMDLVRDELNLCIKGRHVIKKGDQDSKHERKLKEIDSRIKTTVQRKQFTITLVDDALNAAVLSRALERPRREVDGYFARADKLALKYGTLRQRVEVAYQKVWTEFWWYEEEDTIPELYIEVEKRARGSRNIYDMERLATLWYVLEVCVFRETGNQHVPWFKERTKILKSELERLSYEKTRPSAVLQARMLILNMQLRESWMAGEPLDPILKELKEIIEQASSMTGFPMSLTIEMISGFGKYLVAEPGYEELLEAAVRISSEQQQNLQSANLLVQYGQQLLDAGQPYDAIQKLGRSSRLLYNHVGRYDAVRSLYLCSRAYEQAGLLWAARGTLIAAGSLATDEFWKYSKITRSQSFCYEGLKWIELRLGRLPHALIWHKTDLVFKLELVLAEYEGKLEKLVENEKVFDISLGILLLRTDLSDLKWLESLPGELENLKLFHAFQALIYALGYDDDLSEICGYSKDEFAEYFTRLNCQPITNGLPEVPNLCNQQYTIFNSHVLGCEYRVEVENISPCIELAESLLAANEALLASVPITQACAIIPQFPISIKKAQDTEWPFSFKIVGKSGNPSVEIHVSPFNPHRLTESEQVALRSEIEKVVIQLIIESIRFSNSESTLLKLSKDGANDCAFNFTSSFVALGNILGDNASQNLINCESGDSYPVRRSKPWDSEIKKQDHLKKQSIPSGRSMIKHSEIRTVSLIRSGLWDKAGWSGMLFMSGQNDDLPPIIAPIFKDAKAGCAIFGEWRNELGYFDEVNKLALGVVRGINRNRPHSYTIFFKTNTKNIYHEKRPHHLVSINRVHRMTPNDSSNLNHFIDSFKVYGKYILAPAFFATNQPYQINFDVGLVKQHFQIRNAWEIGRNDSDSFAINPNDVPIIPDNIENPPINELLAYIRNLS